MKRWFGAMTSALVLWGTSLGVYAQEYPSKPMTWVVPLAPGGPADTLTRAIAQKVSEQLGTSIVIENLSGAGGTIGAARAARYPADGYHFLMGHLGFMAAAPALYKTLSYDPVGDFTGVMRFPDTPAVLLVPGSSTFESTHQLIDYARDNPGKINVGTAGVGSVSHLVAALFASENQLDVEMIPYKGNAPAMADLMADRIDVVFDQSNTSLSTVRSGNAKALGVGSREPLEQLPGVEPIDSVVPDFEATTWYGLYAPTGTPPEYLRKVEAAYLTVMQDAAFRDQLSSQGLLLLTPEEYRGESFEALTKSEIGRWAAVVQTAGIEPQ